MDLQDAIPLFELDDINWLISTKDITNIEYNILNKYNNVFILKELIEKYDDLYAFYDTMIIMKHLDGVISTDTSLVHVALTLDINTYVLLTKDHEWRWKNKSNWYPKANLIKQTKIKNWKNVINEMILILKK